jgi:hypothetical protein
VHTLLLPAPHRVLRLLAGGSGGAPGGVFKTPPALRRAIEGSLTARFPARKRGVVFLARLSQNWACFLRDRAVNIDPDALL